MADEQQLKDGTADTAINKPSRFGSPSDMFYKAGIPVITALIASASTLLAVWLFAKEPHLSYRVNETVSFQSDKNFISIATFTVTNDGNKEAVDVLCSFDTPGVEDVQLLPADLHAKKDKASNGTGMEVSAPRMIPGEELQVSIYFKNITPPKLLPVKVKCNSTAGSNKPPISIFNPSFWVGAAIGEFIVLCYIFIIIIRDTIRNERRNAVELAALNTFRAKYESDKADYEKAEAVRKAEYEIDKVKRESDNADYKTDYEKAIAVHKTKCEKDQADQDKLIEEIKRNRQAMIDTTTTTN